jgi:transposase-like protein
LEDSKKVLEVADHLGIKRGLLYYWRKQMKKNGDLTFFWQ